MLLNHTYQKLAQTQIIPWLTSLIIGIIAAVSVSFPIQAAEEIRFVFDSVYLFIPVSSLETFAREGKFKIIILTSILLRSKSEEYKSK